MTTPTKSIATATIRVMLIDDYALMRTGLRVLLEREVDIAVVADVATGDEALAGIGHLSPDIIVLDSASVVGRGAAFLERLRSIAWHAQVILLIGDEDVELQRRAVRQGVMGIVMKTHGAADLVQAIRRVRAGEAWLNRSIVAEVLSEMVRGTPGAQPAKAPRSAALTERERAIISLICEGLPNKRIADRLAISEITVRHHLTSIFDKLDVTNRLELVIYAYRHNLVSLSQ